MKRKIGIVIALLLCVVLIFTFVACKKKKNNDPTISQEDQTAMETKIDAYLDAWLLANAQEEGQVTNQKKLLNAALKKQSDSFSFTNSAKEAEAPSYNISFNASTSTYTIEVSWAKGTVKQKFTKQAKTVQYKNWAGKYSKPLDDWLLDSKASLKVDEIIEAGVNLVNDVTGNAITGKFGADGVIGISVAGKTYGLRIKGNVDGTTKANNEIGFAIVNGDGEELGGLYYKAAATAQASKLYFQTSTIENDTRVYSYKYLDYADIFGLLSSVLPQSFPQANDGVLQFKDDDDEPIVIDDLDDIFEIADASNISTIVKAVINMVAQTYEHDGRIYIDINLGSVMAQINDLMSTITLDLAFLKNLNIELENLHGLLGHITISAEVGGDADHKVLSDFELAVNIPECTFYLNGKPDNDPDQLKFDLPAISFAVFVEDFSFLTTGRVQNVIPQGVSEAVYFSPANVNLSGNVYVNHTERDNAEANIDKTFHFEFMTDINPFEIAENKANSTARAALEIKASAGKDYDPEHASTFLKITYEQADRLLCAGGTAFGLEDGGNKIYTFSMKDKSMQQILGELMLWLGMDGDNWNGLTMDASGIKLLEYQLTSNQTFEANKTYYKKSGNSYVVANDYTVGDAVPANTYYVKTTPYESAKTIFGDAYTASIVNWILPIIQSKSGSGNSGAVAEAGFDVAQIGDYFDDFKALYDEFVKDGKIAFDVDENDNLSAKAEVSLDMINQVIAAINATFGAEIKLATDPQFVNVYYNVGDYVGKFYATVKVGDNVYELTIDDSIAKTFKIDFKMTLKSGRVYAAGFTAVKSDDGTTWSASFGFDIRDCEGDAGLVNHTLVTLSNFHGKWGEDNSTKIEPLLPTGDELDTAGDIFPAADIPSVGTALAKGIVKILNKSAVQKIIGMAMMAYMS